MRRSRPLVRRTLRQAAARVRAGRVNAELGSSSRFSFNQLVRPKQQRLREGDAESLRSPEVDHKLEACGLFHGLVGRICSPEHLVHVRRAPVRALCMVPCDIMPPAITNSLKPYIAGSRYFAARSAIRRRSLRVRGSGKTINASALSRTLYGTR